MVKEKEEEMHNDNNILEMYNIESRQNKSNDVSKMNKSGEIGIQICENSVTDENVKSGENNINTEINNVTNQNQEMIHCPLSSLEKKRLKLKKQETTRLIERKIITEEKIKKATLVSTGRLLNDEDFVKIDAALAKQQITYAKNSLKRSHPNDNERGDFVKLTDIENIYKKRKHDKQSRIESVKVSISFPTNFKKLNYYYCHGY